VRQIAFVKKTEQTPKRDLDLARDRKRALEEQKG
jgi:phage-related protein